MWKFPKQEKLHQLRTGEVFGYVLSHKHGLSNGQQPPPEWIVNREIKIRVYGKRERQNLLRDHDFPAIFHVCRLPFAVFNAKRTVFAIVNNVSIYRKFFNLSTKFTGVCLGLMLFYFIFYAK